MRTRLLRLLSLLLLIAAFSFAHPLPAATTNGKSTPPPPSESVAGKKVYLLTIDAAITPVVAEYINKSIDIASGANAEAVIIELDTPGGLVDSMREIVKKMMVADLPVIVYVGPSGARAASAGVFITLAANIAAMAPATHIGAAHPVTMEGKMDKTMETKVVNDLAAMARGIAEKHGRNAKWAEEAVRKSVSITETEALKLKVVDLVTPDIPTLLKNIDGKTVDLVAGKKTLRTANAEIKEINMGFRFKFLNIITNPNVAAILFLVGLFGLYFELSTPGAIFPGVAGTISILLALYAFQFLPINYTGLLLILFGVALFIAEAYITSHGILGVGGTISLLIGLVMLVESGSPYLRISWAVIVPVVALSALLFIFSVSLAVRVHRDKVDTGKEGMVGLEGEAKTDILIGGQVFVRGEYWNAWSAEPIQKGDRVKVESVEGLKLKVKKIA